MVNSTYLLSAGDTLENWYDAQFSINKFKDCLIETNSKSDNIIKTIMEITSDGDDFNNESETKYVVNIDDETKEKIEKGILKLDTSKNGEVYAQLIQSNGHYGKKLSITKELEEKGYSSKEIEMAMQMKSIQDVLIQIVEILDDIGEHVTDLLKGQQSDRAGLYYSGLNMLLESRTIDDETLKKQVIAQAIKSFNDSCSQMIQQIATDIQYLVYKKYDREKGKRQEKIDEKIRNINMSFDIIYRSSFMKAALYNEIGEVRAMLTSCEEYGRFIEKLIVPNSAMLTEMDKNDNKLDVTLWEKRAKSLVKCNEVKSLLNNNKVYLLDIERDN